jgi:hypothetical protein
MHAFTVVLDLDPITGDNWDKFYDLLDSFPGSFGTMDPDEPTMSFVMDADSEDTVRDAIRAAAKKIRIGVVNIDITFYTEPEV